VFICPFRGSIAHLFTRNNNGSYLLDIMSSRVRTVQELQQPQSVLVLKPQPRPRREGRVINPAEVDDLDEDDENFVSEEFLASRALPDDDDDDDDDDDRPDSPLDYPASPEPTGPILSTSEISAVVDRVIAEETVPGVSANVVATVLTTHELVSRHVWNDFGRSAGQHPNSKVFIVFVTGEFNQGGRRRLKKHLEIEIDAITGEVWCVGDAVEALPFYDKADFSILAPPRD